MNTLADIPDDELHWSFARSGGPGGQNVNKVSSKVLLRWHPGSSKGLSEEVRTRLLEIVRTRLTNEGDLLITSQKTRDQPKNIEDCKEKLTELLRQARQRPKVRKPTKPSRASKVRRVEAKRRQSGRKANRRVRGEE
jgi:ribosome-associated protein